MLKNKMEYIDRNEIDVVLEKAEQNNCYIVCIDGKEVQSGQEYLAIMAKKFCFPDNTGWDGYDDWMTDLSWIENGCIVVVISNFMNRDSESKKIVLDLFEDDILPFWEKDVKNIVVDGVTRSFNVYLVD